MEYFAVVDTETNWIDEVMSIGIVIAEKETFKTVDDIYLIIDPAFRQYGMYYEELFATGRQLKDIVTSRKKAMGKIKILLDKYKVSQLFAYNASFDKNHLPEASSYSWFDIMKIAAYRNHNDRIPANTECFKTGRMKRGYGVEQIMRLLSGDCGYEEVHNALFDAIDELKIMELLGKPIDVYFEAEL